MVDTLYFNGDIITMEHELYTEALLIKDGKIAALGTKDKLLSLCGANVRAHDLQGNTLMPAFLDAHSHFAGVAASFLKVPLSEAASFEDIKAAIDRFIKDTAPGSEDWISGTGYDLNLLAEKTHPTREFLDSITTDHPIVLQHVSTHMGVFNSKALELLEITPDTIPPEGGVIEKEGGRLTGLIKENAFVFYIQKVPFGSDQDFFKAFYKAQDKYLQNGITTVQDGMIVPMLSELYAYFIKEQELKIDLVGYVDLMEAEQILKKFPENIKQYHNHFKIGGYKIFLDGSLSGCTAYLSKPYLTSSEDYYGERIHTDDEVFRLIQTALKDNMQLLAHSNGDAACTQYITQYKKALEAFPKAPDLRPVIIHAPMLTEELLKESHALRMVPSFFIANIYYWGEGHIKNLGRERSEHLCPLHTAKDLGIPFTLHQDAPVIDLNILETIQTAVTRKTKHGTVLGVPEQIDVLTALKAVTINAAYQYFEEDQKGSLKENKHADLIILDKNPLKVPQDTIKDIRVLETIKDGITVYSSISG